MAEPRAYWYPRAGILGPDIHVPPFALELFVFWLCFVLFWFFSLFVHKESVHWKSQLKQERLKERLQKETVATHAFKQHWE